MEISRSRIEGLLAAFPKLRSSEDQHTFIETGLMIYGDHPVRPDFGIEFRCGALCLSANGAAVHGVGYNKEQ